MILGLDLSLTATGWCLLRPDGAYTTGTITTNKDRPLPERLLRITNEITYGPVWRTHLPDLIVGIEDGVYRSQAAFKLGLVHGAVRLELWRHGAQTFYIPSAVRCKLATGTGNAGKAEVLAAAIRRLGYCGHSEDEADALWIADATARLNGWDRPALPAGHLKALDKLAAPVA